MNSPKVSIIMPVYNAEKTIRKSLDSVVAQTLNECELIIVDDGSTDSSGKICDDYAKQDSRFIVIHKNNAGVSAARQTGLDAAKGEYVIHVDPDDWIEPEMLELLYHKAATDEADMVICDFFIDVGDKILYSKQCPSSLMSGTVLNDMFGVNSIHGSCCNKLVKRVCINKYQAKFPEGINYCEDICFNIQLLKHDIKVTYLNKALYHYVQHEKSITNKYTLDTLNIHKKYVSFLSEQLGSESIPVVYSKEFVKKLAFRNDVLSKEDFAELYPEITSKNDDNLIMRWIYRLAFTNHFFIAKLLMKFYYLYGKILKFFRFNLK